MAAGSRRRTGGAASRRTRPRRSGRPAGPCTRAARSRAPTLAPRTATVESAATTVCLRVPALRFITGKVVHALPAPGLTHWQRGSTAAAVGAAALISVGFVRSARARRALVSPAIGIRHPTRPSAQAAKRCRFVGRGSARGSEEGLWILSARGPAVLKRVYGY